MGHRGMGALPWGLRCLLTWGSPYATPNTGAAEQRVWDLALRSIIPASPRSKIVDLSVPLKQAALVAGRAWPETEGRGLSAGPLFEDQR